MFNTEYLFEISVYDYMNEQSQIFKLIHSQICKNKTGDTAQC